uniref:Uncharacterized protein n=1 Tax=Escherichia coli TaxID=562 RepID=A0A075M8C9_ECOLX|nr:hypothetical protein [Escherichia coli]
MISINNILNFFCIIADKTTVLVYYILLSNRRYHYEEILSI